ncbi:MAG: toll/interleukin-1 receptor domain-containing protein [Ignavibacteriales bacterium]|nr:MAG: toll/interleukin-1 receptor domain-containing protein [Ignavibacteriales bacterium]
MKDTIFISHANPKDNDFARWISLKLINLGFKVWADVLKLKGGNYTWGEIENEIRNNTIKFLFITSRNSNQAEGCLNELSVADAVKRNTKDDKKFKDFVIPLKIDELPHSEMNIFINKLFAIDFTKSWAIGLQDLLEKLEEDKVPLNKEYSPDFVSNWWNTVYIGGRKVKQQEDEYLSNWFRIIEFPEFINFHKFGRFINSKTDIKNFKYPAVGFSNYLATFAYCFDFMDELPKSAFYSPNDTFIIKTKDVFSDSFPSTLIQKNEAKNVLTQLLKLAWEKKMKTRGFLEYVLANKKKCYALKNNFNETNRIGRIKLVGTFRERTWHYALSSFPKYYPEFGLGIKAHILFSNDGEIFINSKKTQHSLRRRVGKNWWNFHWREKLLAMIEYLSEGNSTIYFEVGSEEKILISAESSTFYSAYSFNEPEKEIINVDENIDTDEIYDESDEDEEEDDDDIEKGIEDEKTDMENEE